jgi:putative acetyltransferase
MTVLIRAESPADIDHITRITRAAFRDDPRGSHNEQDIIAALRAAGQLTVSLVADSAGRVVGHVAVSPVSIADGTPGWYGLGPLAVAPDHQGQGIGSRLVRAALQQLRAMGAAGCVLVGEPAFYGRFGFAHDPALVLAGVPAEVFLALHFTPAHPAGAVTYHKAFLLAD